MRIISFSWTTPALLAGRKTVTRRAWKMRYGRTFREGERIQAYDRSPRVGGRRVAIIELTETPYLQLPHLMADEEYEAEGFRYFEEFPDEMPEVTPWPRMSWAMFYDWRRYIIDPMWVVRFRLVEICE